ncbi:hypothetical protein SAMN05444342_4250 [Haladaptatus paucihalophilus DX253]|uniref:Transcription regulator TrmB N-terminal domain-containing protein n=2 Tax=Haladaptatus paucihalophilus DX253 TaxID=797209 RepID=A0A1M7C1T1_HALPU|nr:hypothetical protein SAMN05444342_4250 [Haladaptatus paucihalophilus DX253]
MNMAENDRERERNEGGEYVQERKPEDALAAMDPGEPYMTSEVANALDWPRRSTYTVLDHLAEDGKIRKKKPEARRVIWIRPE